MVPRLVIFIACFSALLSAVTHANGVSQTSTWKMMITESKQSSDLGNPNEALTFAKESLRLCVGANNTFNKRSLRSLVLIGNLNENNGNLEAAARAYRMAIILHQSHFDANHPNKAHYMCRLAEIYTKQERYDDAEVLFNSARKMLDAPGTRIDPALARSLIGLGSIHASRGQYAEALALYEEGVTIYKLLIKYQPDLKMKVAEGLFAAGLLERKQGEYAKASASYREALLYTDRSMNGALLASQILYSLGDTYSEWLKPARARMAYKQAKQVLMSSNFTAVALNAPTLTTPKR